MSSGKMSTDVARSYGGDGGGEDRRPPHLYPVVAWVALLTDAKANESPIWAAGHELFALACGPTWTLILINSCVVDGVRCQQMLPGPTTVTVEVRIILLHTMYPAVAWVALLTEAKANESPIWAAGQQTEYPRQDPKPFLKGNHGYERPRLDPTQFDLRPHMESPDSTEINAGIQQHLQKAYNTNKAAFKAQHWVIDPTTGLTMWRRSGGHVLRTLRLASGISIFSFGMIPGTLPEPIKIGKTRQRARSYLDRNPGGLLAFEMRWQSSTTQEYPSLIDTFLEEMRRLEAMGTYTDDEINHLARGGKQRGHIPGVGRVLPAQATASPSTPAHESTLNSLHKKVDFMMSLFKSESKYSDMFSQFESGGASGSGGCGDDEEGADHRDDEDEDDDGDT
nr:F-box domain, leucine-rich repeat domain, L domain-like protein [Tanacetum cinerariifolium]